jgi:hypothetical protein
VKLSTLFPLLSTFVSGCTVIGHQDAPSDWPALDIVKHSLSHKDMRDACSKWTHPLASPEACAEIRFTENRCDVYLSADFPNASNEEHEYEHCRGKDHAGGTYLRDLWAKFKAAR